MFLQGCPLKCWWCHNPEARADESSDMMAYEVPALASILERDARYWTRSGGGVTLSGGEPLHQAAGSEELLAALGRRKHHRTVETSGTGALKDVQRIVPHADLWLWDLKAVDSKTYHEGTGGDVTVTLSSLSWLLQTTSTAVVARIPLIPDFNLSAGELTSIADWLSEQPRSVQVELLPGHGCGWAKRKNDKPRREVSVDTNQLEWARGLLERNGISVRRKPTGGLA